MFKKKLKFNSMFFWKKKSEKPERFVAIMDELIKRIPEVRKLIKDEQRKEGSFSSDGFIVGQMYDFYNAFANDRFEFDTTGMDDGDRLGSGVMLGVLPPPPKIEIAKLKPADVVDKLETTPERDFTTQNIDEMILLFKNKSELICQRYAKKEVDGFVKRLENRKHYYTHRDFFKRFPNTTDDAINNLIEKYDLVMKESELFIPTFPKEATDVMMEYNKQCKLFTDELPVYYVIAEKKDFKEKVKKLDPILLVQSPFGFYWQILGAWDKEMLLLSEL